MLYAGVDAHKRTSQVTVMDESGAVVKRARVPSTRAGIQHALGRYGGPMKAVVEASYCWGPMHDWLDEVADDVVLAHPLKVRAIAEARIKTDAIDADTLAHLLRADLIPVAYAPSKETRASKRILRQRMFLVRVRTMLKNRVQALLSQHSIARPDVTDLFGQAGMRWLKALELPDPDMGLLHEQLALMAALREHIQSTEGMIRELVEGDEAVDWLRSLPGIGPFFSVLIRYEVDDIRRFREAKKFASYTGLVPSTYASGDRMMHGRLTKQGNKWLRWAFVEAVNPAITRSCWLRRYYEGIKKRRGVKDARTATARKLAELAWTIWTEQRPYEERG
jgi:transposase|tara:strand:+ start:97 stop:1101 length:1005 start_codon:yes stop_codon:yes gene_type:complete